jgi:hypothetical protein
MPFDINAVKVALDGDIRRVRGKRFQLLDVDHEQLRLAAIGDEALQIALGDVVVLPGGHDQRSK